MAGRVFSGAAFLFLVLTPSLVAQTLLPSDDAFVSSASGSANFGSLPGIDSGIASERREG